MNSAENNEDLNNGKEKNQKRKIVIYIINHQ